MVKVGDVIEATRETSAYYEKGCTAKIVELSGNFVIAKFLTGKFDTTQPTLYVAHGNYKVIEEGEPASG